jgi:hypothetical protein
LKEKFYGNLAFKEAKDCFAASLLAMTIKLAIIASPTASEEDVAITGF